MAEDRIRIIVEPDTTGFQRELDSDLSRVQSDVTVDVLADTTPAKVSIQKFEAGVEADPIDIPVTTDTTRARTALSRFTAAAQAPINKVMNVSTVGAQKSFKALEGAGTKAFNSIGTAAKASGVGALLLLGTAAIAGKEELLDMNRVSGQTEAILKRSGLAARVSAADIEALSGATLKKAGIDDQAIQSGINFLLTQEAIQDSVKATPKFLDDATSALANLAASPIFKGNAEAAAKALGKALGDPTKGLAALRKAGVLFTKDEQERIKTLQESGRVQEAQAIILGKVDKQLGGLADARGKSAEGQLTRLSEAFAGLGAGILSKALPALLKIGEILESAFSDTGVITRFAGAFKPLGRVITIIGDSFSRAFDGVGDGANIIDRIAEKMEEFAKLVEDNQWVVDTFAETFAELAKSVGPLLLAWLRQIAPVLKSLAIVIGLVVVGLVKVVTWIAQLITKFYNFMPTLTQVGTALGEWINSAIVWFQKLWDDGVKILTGLINFIRKIPRMVMMGITIMAVLVAAFFRRVWTSVVTITRTIITSYITFVRSIPGMIINGLIALGQLLWNFATNAWNRFRSAMVTAVGNIIEYVRGIPGRITSGLGALSTLLVEKGEAVMTGLWDGLKAGWKKVKEWLSGIGDKIKSLKGPIEVDRTLLVDEGAAIMGGFQKGLESKWDGVENWLEERGGFIKGILNPSGLQEVWGLISDLFTGKVDMGEVTGKMDELMMGSFSPSSGEADTRRQAEQIERLYGLMITSLKRGYDTVSGPNVSQHVTGHAADFVNRFGSIFGGALDRAARELSRWVGRAFTQIIWLNRLWVGGAKTNSFVDDHMDHLHVGWIPRRHGGNVHPGGHYMVGEEGPEPFIPSRPGFILSNAKFNRMLAMDQRVNMLESIMGGNRSMVGTTGSQVTQDIDFNIELKHGVNDAGSLMAILSTRLQELIRANVANLAGGIA
jgi:hypothetical protein